MNAYVISFGELEPEDAALLPALDQMKVIGERRIRAVVTDGQMERAFLSAPYNLENIAEQEQAFSQLMAHVTTKIIEREKEPHLMPPENQDMNNGTILEFKPVNDPEEAAKRGTEFATRHDP